MRKFVTLALVGALVLGTSSVVYANVCAFDPVPAATLLFPFVAFDYNNPISGTTTLMAVTNVSSEAEIVHVTLWTDYSRAIFDFNIILSGYDVQTLNVRDWLYLGQLPKTGTTGDLLVSPNDAPLADGPVSPPAYTHPFLDPAEGTNVIQNGAPPAARCRPNDIENYPGYPNYPIIQQSSLDLLRTWLSYSQTFSNVHDASCDETTAGIGDWFENRNETDVTWMYITMDVVWNCNLFFPDLEPRYFVFNDADPDLAIYTWAASDVAGQKRVRNVLMGDVFWLNNALRFSEADHAVHLEANPYLANVATVPPGELDAVSFYYRYATLQSDYREPLPTAWAFRYLGWQSDAFDTWIRAFKMATFVPVNHRDLENRVVDLDLEEGAGELIALDCMAYTYFAWDENEDVGFSTGVPWSFPGQAVYKPNLLPLETQEVNVDQFNMVDTSGWVLFIWPASNWDDPLELVPVNVNRDWYQTWMGVKYGAYGDYTAAMNALVMANFNCFADQVYPGLGINYPYITPPGGTGFAPVPHAGDYTISWLY